MAGRKRKAREKEAANEAGENIPPKEKRAKKTEKQDYTDDYFETIGVPDYCKQMKLDLKVALKEVIEESEYNAVFGETPEVSSSAKKKKRRSKYDERGWTRSEAKELAPYVKYKLEQQSAMNSLDKSKTRKASPSASGETTSNTPVKKSLFDEAAINERFKDAWKKMEEAREARKKSSESKKLV